MPASTVLRALQTAIKQSAAIGINNTLQTVLADLKQHVPVRTGRLQAGFLVTQLATADTLQGQIGNPVFYAAAFYPFRSPPTALNNGPTLFSPPPGKVPVTDGKRVDTTQVGALLRVQVERSLQQALNQ